MECNSVSQRGCLPFLEKAYQRAEKVSKRMKEYVTPYRILVGKDREEVKPTKRHWLFLASHSNFFKKIMENLFKENEKLVIWLPEWTSSDFQLSDLDYKFSDTDEIIRTIVLAKFIENSRLEEKAVKAFKDAFKRMKAWQLTNEEIDQLHEFLKFAIEYQVASMRDYCELRLTKALVFAKHMDGHALFSYPELHPSPHFTGIPNGLGFVQCCDAIDEFSQSRIEKISQMVSLKRLNFQVPSMNNYDFITLLSHFTALEGLKINNCGLLTERGLDCISKLTSLQSLDLSRIPCNDDESESIVTPLTNLTHLSLEDCENINGDVFASFSVLTKLRSLKIGSCLGLDEELALQNIKPLTQLKSLVIDF